MSDKTFQYAGIESFPLPLQRALTNDVYNKGDCDFSVTQLIGPPQKTYLKQNLNEEEVVHPYNHIYSMLGTAVHNILENNADPEAGETAEVRLYMDIHGHRVSGQIDLHMKDEKFVNDWKFTGGHQTEMKVDHHKQAQMNGLLAQENGYEVEVVGITYIQRDWSIMRAHSDPNYPQSPINTIVVDYDREFAIAEFSRSVLEHSAALKGSPRPCTKDEKWQSETSYALMKAGGKRASKVCATREEAETLRKPDQIIEEREQVATYCEYFCGLRHVCPQYKREQLRKMSMD